MFLLKNKFSLFVESLGQLKLGYSIEYYIYTYTETNLNGAPTSLRKAYDFLIYVDEADMLAPAGWCQHANICLIYIRKSYVFLSDVGAPLQLCLCIICSTLCMWLQLHVSKNIFLYKFQVCWANFNQRKSFEFRLFRSAIW